MSQWWIDENKLMGSSNPTVDELKELYQGGFRTIISFLDENEQKPYYHLDEIETIGFKRVSIPIKDFTAPTMDSFKKFLNAVNQALSYGKVIIHCQAGTGRTGTMAAAYWINQGLSAEEAIKRIRNTRPGAVGIPEQEESLFNLDNRLKEKK